jgi:uncharacterized protein (DUF1015 family)
MPPTTPPVPHGLVLQPFRALRFGAASELTSLISPPYDVIDDDERIQLEARSPHNAVRLILPREPEQPAAAGTTDRYTAAAELLHAWTDQGVLVRDAEPGLYVYEQQVDGHAIRGLLGGVGLARAEAGIVLPHENTMAGPVADRLALLRATEADLEPIFLVYAGGGTASALLADVVEKPPLVDVTGTQDGATVRHRLWSVTDPGLLAAVAEDLAPRRATIADGHHRYATYLKYQEERHASGDGPGPWDFGLAFLVDASAYGPEVHPIHRVVPTLSFDDAVRGAARGFATRAVDVPAALDELAQAGRSGTAFVLTDGTRAVLLTDPDPAALAAALPDDRSAAWRSLDVTVAHAFLIRRLWEIEDSEDVVDFAHDAATAVRTAESTGGTALLVNSTPVEAVAAVAQAGDRMPRKSTLFTPKPATGIVFRLLH